MVDRGQDQVSEPSLVRCNVLSVVQDDASVGVKGRENVAVGVSEHTLVVIDSGLSLIGALGYDIFDGKGDAATTNFRRDVSPAEEKSGDHIPSLSGRSVLESGGV